MFAGKNSLSQCDNQELHHHETSSQFFVGSLSSSEALDSQNLAFYLFVMIISRNLQNVLCFSVVQVQQLNVATMTDLLLLKCLVLAISQLNCHYNQEKDSLNAAQESRIFRLPLNTKRAFMLGSLYSVKHHSQRLLRFL